MELSICVQVAISQAIYIADQGHDEYLTPEHLLRALLNQEQFYDAINKIAGKRISDTMGETLDKILDALPCLDKISTDYKPETTLQFDEMLNRATTYATENKSEVLDVPDIAHGMMRLQESAAAHMLLSAIHNQRGEFITELKENYAAFYAGGYHPDEQALAWDEENGDTSRREDVDPIIELEAFDQEAGTPGPASSDAWRRYVTDISGTVDDHNPLVGREAELASTVRVLCRKDKNNPLHVGDAGVGKTALIYGLARRIGDGNVPERLKGCHIYGLEMATMVAGTQFRGDFEQRFKNIMDGLAAEGNAILYLDEIHQIMGAGSTSDSSMDMSNMLKPYLEQGTIRFIGSTTHEEYNRYIMRNKGIVRRFQTIEIAEPSRDDAVEILRQLAPRYEDYHNVTYGEGTLELAVDGSIRHLPGRRLPDKALDVIDEAGAAAEASRDGNDRTTIDVESLAGTLARIAGVDAHVVTQADAAADNRLASLQQRILGRLYGQDEAVKQVVEAVQMARAGLLDEGRPLANLLFVGPTGVGKTELARVLSDELGVKLVRFDMSEYVEKHTVAKLIGAPAGYVGYDDGGLLTDAVRRNPDCVLLLDEIEKAHEDIYNILLQVMDYGVLTDNKGQKAYFRNVILIMTSNAGAQFASQASVGFASNVTSGKAMLAAIKRTFKPEFINRLSSVVVFNDMDDHMANLILDKKLRELDAKLAARGVSITLTAAARDLLLRQGFTPRYGAREMDRVITQRLKSLLTRHILFGDLAGGGHATIDVDDDTLKITHSE